MAELMISYKEDEKPIEEIVIKNFCDPRQHLLKIKSDSGTLKIEHFYKSDLLIENVFSYWRLKPQQAKELGEALIKLSKQIRKGM